MGNSEILKQLKTTLILKDVAKELGISVPSLINKTKMFWGTTPQRVRNDTKCHAIS